MIDLGPLFSVQHSHSLTLTQHTKPGHLALLLVRYRPSLANSTFPLALFFPTASLARQLEPVYTHRLLALHRAAAPPPTHTPPHPPIALPFCASVAAHSPATATCPPAASLKPQTTAGGACCPLFAGTNVTSSRVLLGCRQAFFSLLPSHLGSHLRSIDRAFVRRGVANYCRFPLTCAPCRVIYLDRV